MYGELTRPANCIPCALSFAFPEDIKLLVDSAQKFPPTQHSSEAMPVRMYGDWQSPKLDGKFNFIVQDNMPTTNGKYIMHVGGKGQPHAVYLQVLDAGKRYIIRDGQTVMTLEGAVMDKICKRCVDRKTLVFCKVEHGSGPLNDDGPTASPLEKLSAGR